MDDNKLIRDSFVFYRSFYEQFEKLPNDTIKVLMIKIVSEYALNGTDIYDTLEGAEIDDTEKRLLELVFIGIEPQIKANNKRFLDGKKGGRPKKTKTEEKQPSIDYIKDLL